MKRLSTLCLALTSLLFAANAQVSGDYRSAGTGDWNVAATWQRHNGTSFVAAPTAPDQGDGVIHIRNGHTVTVNTAVTADQIIVDAGGILEQVSDLNGIAIVSRYQNETLEDKFSYHYDGNNFSKKEKTYPISFQIYLKQANILWAHSENLIYRMNQIKNYEWLNHVDWENLKKNFSLIL